MFLNDIEPFWSAVTGKKSSVEDTLEQFMCKEFRGYGSFIDQNKMRKQRFNRANLSIGIENVTFYSGMDMTVLKQFENLKHKFRWNFKLFYSL